jgi:sulfide:quinone oxidoreductase
MEISAPAPHDGCMAAPQLLHAPPYEAQDMIAFERWINEGGRLHEDRDASRPVRRRTPGRSGGRGAARPLVLIAGAGLAALETLLALRALAADQLDISLLAPGWTFTDRAAAIRQPFEAPCVRTLRLADVASDLGARWYQTTLDRVELSQHRVVTTDGDRLAYDSLVLAIGARPARAWQSDGVVTIGGGHDDVANSYPVVLHRLRTGQIKRLAFVRPAGAGWSTPLYDLALLTAAYCAAHDLHDVELSLVTPEQQPLGMFGASWSASVRRLLDESGVTLHTGSHGRPYGRGWLDISPGDRGMRVDRIVTQPRLLGPRLRGIPAGPDGFIQTDPNGRLTGVGDVYAAGDATNGQIKHGELAAQQADAVAATIARSAGIAIESWASRPPAARGLINGGSLRNRRDAHVGHGSDAEDATTQASSWSTPNTLGLRYRAPSADSPCGGILPHDRHAIDILLDRVAAGSRRTCVDVLDLAAR